MDLRPYQIPIFRDNTTGVLILHWSRQIGKSTVLSAWAIDRCLTRPGRLVTVLSNSMQNGLEFAEKCKALLTEYGATFEAVSQQVELEMLGTEIRLTVHGRKSRIKVLSGAGKTQQKITKKTKTREEKEHRPHCTLRQESAANARKSYQTPNANVERQTFLIFVPPFVFFVIFCLKFPILGPMHPDYERADQLTKPVIGAAIEVHRHYGPGLIESIYERSLLRELFLRKISAVNQRKVLIDYKGFVFEETLKFDVLVEACLLLELKCVEEIAPIHKAQLLSYMKLLNVPIGLILNFREQMLMNGIARLLLPGANDIDPPRRT